MNREQIKEKEYNHSRISSLSIEEWKKELESVSYISNFKPLKNFEDFIKGHYKVFSQGLDPIFELFSLKEQINNISNQLGLDKRSLILQFNQFFRYTLDDMKMVQRQYLRRYCNLNLDSITEEQINCIDQDRPKHHYQLIPENIQNIILRYHLEHSKQPTLKTFNLHMPSSRKLSSQDFNDLILQEMSISELEIIIKKQYYYLDYNTIYQEYIYRIEQQDKFYFINYYKNREKIDNELRLLDNKEFNLYNELQTKKQEMNITKLSIQIDRYCQEIKEELELVKLILQFDLLIDRQDWLQAKSFLLNYSLSNHQHCLLLQVLNGTLDLSVIRYTNKYRNVVKEIINELLSRDIICDQYISDKEPPCTHKTFHYYTLHKWVLAFNKLLKRKEILQPSMKTLHPDQKLSMNTLLTDPKNGFCNKCYNSYDRLKNIIINSNKIDPKAPRELFYVLLKYKNKMPLYRVKFSDNCDIQSELYPTLNHYNEYITSLDGFINIQRQLIQSISQYLFLS